jgi:hypothetical protein
MGFDASRIPMLANALLSHPLPLFTGRIEDLLVESNRPELCGGLEHLAAVTPFQFRAPLGWVGFMERRVAEMQAR